MNKPECYDNIPFDIPKKCEVCDWFFRCLKATEDKPKKLREKFKLIKTEKKCD